MYIRNRIYFNAKCFLLKHKKGEQQIHQTTGICDLAVVKPTHRCGLVTVAAALSEVSWCWSEMLDEMWLFLSFILECGCSQMSVLPKSDDVDKMWLWREGHLCAKRGLVEVWLRDMIRFWTEYLMLSYWSDCSSIHSVVWVGHACFEFYREAYPTALSLFYRSTLCAMRINLLL